MKHPMVSQSIDPLAVTSGSSSRADPACKGSPASWGTDLLGSHVQQPGSAMCCVQGAGCCKRAMRASAAAAICSRRFIASASAFVSLLPLPSSLPLQAPASAQHRLQVFKRSLILLFRASSMSLQLRSLAVMSPKMELGKDSSICVCPSCAWLSPPLSSVHGPAWRPVESPAPSLSADAVGCCQMAKRKASISAITPGSLTLHSPCTVFNGIEAPYLSPATASALSKNMLWRSSLQAYRELRGAGMVGQPQPEFSTRMTPLEATAFADGIHVGT